MNYKNYFKDYSTSIFDLLKNVDTDLIDISVAMIKNVKKNNGKVYIVGNGGSASIASHVSVDLAKVCKIPSATFNNSNLITCFANDFGYENWVKEAIKSYSNNNDLFILLSSSGKSPNIVNAGKYCKQNNLDLITFSGFKKNNSLSQCGKVNFHVLSENYNYIEMTHHIILLAIADIFVRK